MNHSNDINYFSSLELLVNGYGSEYPFNEKNVNEIDQVYETRIDTENLFAGDRLMRFILKADNITKVILTIDGISVYSENFKSCEDVFVTPFEQGIRIFSCKNSEIILYIKSSSKPCVKTIYNLLNYTQKANYQETIGELFYRNGHAFLNLPPVGR